MNVPNQYKGFSRLPESVQQKMDPSLAQRYQMGGPVMQRPLFRQAGGPAQPMPQDMMPPPPPPAAPGPMGGQMGPQEQQLIAAEQSMAGQMEQVGQEYAGQMMAGLDAAEDMKGVIDALRGNDKPLQARYNELAGLVGPEDAQATPESVLALVQPTIMMTEQGAVDSGIGELMQGIASNVEMETPTGAPTPMAGGVGALMAQGAGNTPPANFSQGGPVRLQGGGDPTLESLYQQMLPTYQSIMGDPEQQKQAARSQALFAIADAAGRFAAGQGAGGQDLRGLSPAAQLAGATTGLGAQLGALGAANQQQEQAMKLAALQAAQGEYSAITAAQRVRAGKSPEFSITTLFGPDGKKKSINTATSEGILEAQKLISSGYTDQKPSDEKSKFTEFDGNLYDVSGQKPVLVLKGSNNRDIEQVGDTLLDITDPDNIITLYTDETSEQKVTTIDGQLIDYTDPANVKILYSATPDIKTITVGNVVLDITDPTKIKELYKGSAPRKTTTVDGQLIDYTDPANVTVLFGDKTRKYQVMGGKLLDITDASNVVTVHETAQKPDIRIFNNQAVDFTDVSNPKVVFTAPKETKTANVGGVLLDVTDISNVKELYRQDPVQKTATVQGQLIDYTDPADVKVLFGDKTRKYQVIDNTLLDITDPGNPVEVFKAKTKSDIRIVDGRAVDFTDPDNPKTIYEAPKDVKTTTIGGVLLDITDPNNVKELYKQPGEQKTTTVSGQLIDYTDPENVKVLFGDKKREYKVINGTLLDITDPSSPVEVFTVAESPQTLTERMQAIVQDVDLMKRYSEGKTTPSEEAKIQGAISELSTPRAGSNVAPPLPVIIQDAEKARAALGLPTQIPMPEETPTDIANNLPLKQYGGAAFGTGAFFRNMFNAGVSIFFEGAPAERTKEGLSALNSLNESAKIAFRNMTPGRAEEAVTNFATLLPKGAKIIGNRTTAASQIRSLITFFEREVDQAQKDLVTIGSFSERQKAEQALEQGVAIIKAYNSLLDGIQQDLNPAKPNVADFDRDSKSYGQNGG